MIKYEYERLNYYIFPKDYLGSCWRLFLMTHQVVCIFLGTCLCMYFQSDSTPMFSLYVDKTINKYLGQLGIRYGRKVG